VLLRDGTRPSAAPPLVRLDVDQIMRGMARRALDPVDVPFKALLRARLERIDGPSRSWWEHSAYTPSDRYAMLELLRDYGYRAGQHMGARERVWSEDLRRAGYRPGMVVSSYALYFIAVAGAPKPVIALNEYQNGRSVASHAAPFDADFRLQANIAVGGNFFKHNMNTPDSMEGARNDSAGSAAARPHVPYAADPKLVGLHPGAQFLQSMATWLPSWLADSDAITNASFDVASFTVGTPPLGDHTRFVIHRVTHAATRQ